MTRNHPRTCPGCRTRPVATSRSDVCYDCMPDGPHIPPPCRNCGSDRDYYSSGLCRLCHPFAPQPPGSCRDCHAWGVTRRGNWLCRGCTSWRARPEHYPVANCPLCGHHRPTKPGGTCRLCWRQTVAERIRRHAKYFPAAEANRHGQQLYFDLPTRNHRAAGPRSTAAVTLAQPVPVEHRQTVLFDLPRDLAAGLRRSFPEPPDLGAAAFLDDFVLQWAAQHGWTKSPTNRVRQGIRILLGTQDTPGAPIRAQDVQALSAIKLPALQISRVLAAVGLLDDDLVSTVVPWFDRKAAGLPVPMAEELRTWFVIMLNGSGTPPRSRPRDHKTIRLLLLWSLPALQKWAAMGHMTLREITREHVLDVLPASGSDRSHQSQGLRSLFRILKARKVVFANPTARLRTLRAERRDPLPLAPVVVRERLDSSHPTAALVSALLVFHALMPGQIRDLHLADIRDGRLHLDERDIPLARPVQQRLTAYLAHRQRRWPHTLNPHLIINLQTAPRTDPVGPMWFHRLLGMTPRLLREDRILDEVRATDGDLRRVCDLFDMSIYGAVRYTSSLENPEVRRLFERDTAQHQPSSRTQ